MPSLRAFSPRELEEALVRALETYGVAKETTLSSINGKTPSLTPAGNVPISVSEDVVGVAKETTLSSINGKTPSLTAAGNRPIAISEDAVGLLKEATFTGRLDRIVRPDTPEVGKDQLIAGIEGDAVGLLKDTKIPTALQQDVDGAVYLVVKTDLVGLLKETTFTGRLDRLIRPDTPEVGKDQLIAGIEGDAVGLAKETTLSGLVTKMETAISVGKGLDLTVAQSITLDLNGRTVLSVIASSTAATDYTLEVSDDGVDWRTVTTWAAVTSVMDVFRTGARYARLSSAAAGVTGDTVDLILMAGR